MTATAPNSPTNTPSREPERDERVARRARRDARVAHRVASREERWTNFRYAVPYRTDGPKMSMGLLWFVSIMGAVWIRGLLVIIPISVAVTIGAFQLAHIWLTDRAAGETRYSVGEVISVSSFRFICAALALLVAVGGWGGMFGLGLSMVVAVLIAVLCGSWFGGSYSSVRAVEMAALIVRCAIPIGVAGGSLVAVAVTAPKAFVVLFVLISAYEAADFLVGTGSSNAIEGPIAGVAAVAVAAFALRLVPPEPLTTASLTAFAVLAALSCVTGQLLASAIMPRGGAYAPGLRRLDSALLTAPLWLVLLPL